MTKKILIDKFLLPVIISFFGSAGVIYSSLNWFWYFIPFISILVIFSLVGLLTKDLYIQNYSTEKEIISIQYQVNFSESDTNFFKLKKSLIISSKFRSKSFLEPFNTLNIKYLDEEGNRYTPKTFKILDDHLFTKLICDINPIENTSK